MNQISIFDLIDESDYLTPEEKVFNSIIERGANVVDSLKRIKKNINLPMNSFIAFLKNEFGTGGSCYKGYYTWWDGKGLKAGVDRDRMKTYSWDRVAKAFKDKYGGIV